MENYIIYFWWNRPSEDKKEKKFAKAYTIKGNTVIDVFQSDKFNEILQDLKSLGKEKMPFWNLKMEIRLDNGNIIDYMH